QIDRDAAAEGKNSPRTRWKRAVFLVNRLKDGNDMLSPSQTGSQDSHYDGDAVRKHLETQHWLELIDGQEHRYGSNRLNYLVSIDNTGKLRWARNGQLVDTTAGRWKDAGDGRGIVPLDDPSPSPADPRHSFVASPPDSRSSSSSGVSGDEVDAVMHYVGIKQQSKNPIKRLFLRNFTPRGLLERLLRKTVRRNTWIYVSVRNASAIDLEILTGSGYDSHVVTTVRALSHLHRFISVLEERGVDMDKVETSKAELALWGSVPHHSPWKKLLNISTSALSA
ncbi:uncharacterized protein BXZ73DRAFT_39569, partial [Epithele typhae]|uniref:uncharacterized protein n=1 Tax=Epithele typhae TaxID=378194 RepID=UPI0020086FE9